MPGPRKLGDPRRYRPTVGLITAIPEELVAMRALLDNVSGHDVPGDPAHYVRGTLPSRDPDRRHEVVLTQLGATANNAAADGSTHLLRSFPSVRILVMAGTAAGVPKPYQPDRHVRLGDIVAATYGICDYEHLRVTSGGAQPRASFPLPSPTLVRCADMLKADELAGLRPWERWLDIRRRPGLASFGRPAESTDIVYDSAGRRTVHPRRGLNGPRKGYPKVHYGLIGSADWSVNDARVRDQLAEKYDILAFEMEGAGIGSSGFLNGLEWFVVRGVSDYGDGRRDAAWCRYASLAAAAYVRALLATCLPFDSERGDV